MKFYYRKLFFIPFFIILFGASCSKDVKVDVYGPPNASVHFSDVSDFIIDSAGKGIEVKAHVTSDAGIAQIALVYDAWSLNKVISSFPDPLEYDLDEAVTIPQDAALKIHSLKLEVTDKNGNKSATEIKIGLEDLNYATLYLVDNESASNLIGNLFGVPIAMAKISSHTYQVTYYASDENTSVRFIPNAASLSPVAIGADPANDAKLITDAA
ncbi:MAG: hypothetical protein WAS23_13080, partial [Dokdonella sp.]|uniref:hypothetical protein n=1 Tax=Dokdonella sp. TaxID=2291710 RepID=UPI003BB14AB7